MKIRKSIEREEQRWKRSRKFVKHHIVNRCRGGTKDPANLIRLDEQREKAWHFLFKNLSFTEVAELLLRTVKTKKAYH